MANRLPRVTLVVDPRFSGGTSTAVASEIEVLAEISRLRIVAISSGMFSGQVAHQSIVAACRKAGLEILWDPIMISDEIVVLHNPSFLKFDESLRARIVADRLFVVCHENFLRPTGGEGFAVGHCLGVIHEAALCRQKILAPISAWNRATVTDWIDRAGGLSGWRVSPTDWTNICAFDMRPPTDAPRDRRGRHSRPGFEKFPDMDTMEMLYPPQCEAVRILGADIFLGETVPAGWDLIPFLGEAVDAFLSTIDFFVYFTNPTWRESFGRAICEAIAAGKVVITDPGTASTFGQGVIGATPADVDAIVAEHIARPDLYARRVHQAQSDLQRFSAEVFGQSFLSLLDRTARPHGPTQPRAEDFYAAM